MNTVVIAVVVAIGLLSANIAYAEKENYGINTGNSQKLRVNVELEVDNAKKMGKTLVWLSYKNVVQSKYVDFKGKKNAEISFLFPPLKRPVFFLDAFSVCAKNLKTSEQGCGFYYRYGNGVQESYLKVFNTKS